MGILYLIVVSLSVSNSFGIGEMSIMTSKQWTGNSYPDIRYNTKTGENPCGIHTERHGYICDPDRILTHEQAVRLNSRLLELAKTTPCQCQRKSQCMSQDKNGKEFELGFVVAVALVNKLLSHDYDPSDDEKNRMAESFTKTVMGRWALGDCGNSAVMVYWKDEAKVFISRGRVMEKYLTDKEIYVTQLQAKAYIKNNDIQGALLNIIGNIDSELHGDPEAKVDTGTLSLIVSVTIASLLVCIITGCVCAFRCCGNMHPEPGTPVSRIDSIRHAVIRRGSQLRRSFSRSPKFTPHMSPQPLPQDTQMKQILGYDCVYPEGTSIV